MYKERIIDLETGVEQVVKHADRLTPPYTPEVVSRRQARRALLDAGLLDKVEPAISAMPSPQREIAMIEWQDATEFRRDHFLIAQLGASLGLSGTSIDTLFIAAAAL